MIVSTVVGNLGKAAESKQVGSSTCVEFSVASTRKVKGEKFTTWIRCSYFGKPAESVAQYLQKGTQVAVAGDMALREYKRNDGTAGTSLELRVSSLQLCGSGSGKAAGGSSQGASDDSGTGGGYSGGTSAGTDDEIPF